MKSALYRSSTSTDIWRYRQYLRKSVCSCFLRQYLRKSVDVDERYGALFMDPSKFFLVGAKVGSQAPYVPKYGIHITSGSNPPHISNIGSIFVENLFLCLMCASHSCRIEIIFSSPKSTGDSLLDLKLSLA